MNEVPRQKLAMLVTRFGLNISDDARLCEALLRDVCRDQYKREVFLLTAAVKDRVAFELSNAGNGTPNDVLITRLSQRLQNNLGLQDELARWTVESWAIALGTITQSEATTSLRAPAPADAVLPDPNESPISSLATEPDSSTSLKLDRSRDLLLDLTLRNRLLNFPQGNPQYEDSHDRVQKNLPLMADLEKVWQKLVVEEQAAQIYSINGEAELNRIISGGQLASNADQEHLEKRLQKLFREHQTLQASTGDSAFFLTLGFLEWREAAPKESRSLFAPLLLLHVRMVRKTPAGGRRPFLIEMDADQHSGNPSLQEKLKVEHNLVLPSSENVQSPGTYFREIENAIAFKPGWKVHRTVALGFFNFARYRLWLDLDEREWPPRLSPGDHPIVRGFIDQTWCGSKTLPPTEDEISLHQEKHDLPVVLEADSTQYAALLAASRGDSIVVIGPPGSGKSQTITNLIALSMAQGKRVLFVAQKKAALEVVQRLISEVGLSTYCLPLHSDYLKPVEVHKQLSAARLSRNNQVTTDTPTLRSKNLATILNDLAARLRKEPDGWSESAAKLVQRAYICHSEMQNALGPTWDEALLDIDIPQLAIDKAWLEERRQCLSDWSALKAGDYDAWHGWQPKKLFAVDLHQCEATIKATKALVEKTVVAMHTMPESISKASIEHISHLFAEIERLPVPDSFVPGLLHSIWKAGSDTRRFHQLGKQLRDYHSLREGSSLVILSSNGNERLIGNSVLTDVSELLARFPSTTSMTTVSSIVDDYIAVLSSTNDFIEELELHVEGVAKLAPRSYQGPPTFGILDNLAAIHGHKFREVPAAAVIELARYLCDDPALISKVYDFADQLSHSKKLTGEVIAVFPAMIILNREQRKVLVEGVRCLIASNAGDLKLSELANVQIQVNAHIGLLNALLHDLDANAELAALIVPRRELNETLTLASRAAIWTTYLVQSPSDLSYAIVNALAKGITTPAEVVRAAKASDHVIRLRNQMQTTISSTSIFDVGALPKIPILSKIAAAGGGKCNRNDLSGFVQICRAMSATLDQGISFFQAIAKFLGQPAPVSFDDFERLDGLVKHILIMPTATRNGLLDRLSSIDQFSRTRSVMANCIKVHELRGTLASLVKFENLPTHEEIKRLRAVIVSKKGKIFRKLTASYRATRRSIQKVFKAAIGPDSAVIKGLDQLDEFLATIHNITSDKAVLDLLGSHFRGVDTDWGNASELFDWANSFYTGLNGYSITMGHVTAFRIKNGTKLGRSAQTLESVKKYQLLLDSSALSRACGLKSLSAPESESLSDFKTLLVNAQSLCELAMAELSTLGCAPETSISAAVVAFDGAVKVTVFNGELDDLEAKVRLPLRSIGYSALIASVEWFNRGVANAMSPALLAWLANQPQLHAATLIAIVKQCSSVDNYLKVVPPFLRQMSAGETLKDYQQRVLSISSTIAKSLPPLPAASTAEISLLLLFDLLGNLDAVERFQEASITWNRVFSQDFSRIEVQHIRETASWIDDAVRGGTPLAFLSWCLESSARSRIGWWLQLLQSARSIRDALHRLFKTGLIQPNELDSSFPLSDWLKGRMADRAKLSEIIDRLIGRLSDSSHTLKTVQASAETLLRSCEIADDLLIWEPQLGIVPTLLREPDVETHRELEVRISSLPMDFQEWLVSEECLESIMKVRSAKVALTQLVDSHLRLTSLLSSFGAIIESGPSQLNKPELTLSALRDILTRLCSHSPQLLSWATLLRLEDRLESLSLLPFINLSRHKSISGDQLLHVFEAAVAFQQARRLFRTDSKLASFDGFEANDLRRRFANEDEKTLVHNRTTVFEQISMLPGGASSQAVSPGMYTILSHEENKQRRHWPIRKLVEATAPLMQKLCPCWLMTPLDVAQMLKPGAIQFDLVIMDEASQLPPEDAWGVIARGKQIVVVGDPKQMPPSDFFSAASNDEEDIDEEELDGGKLDSILDTAKNCIHQTDLLWHYRSRHQSLIAPANRFSYNDRLILFPSAYAQHQEMGVRHKLVVGATATTGRVVNSKEAAAVVDRLVEIAFSEHKKPLKDRRSVGVIAMNQGQMDCIQELVDEKRRTNSAIDRAVEALEENTAEPLLVMNLENVQGDQRDIILISYTYAANRPGATLNNRFGPINLDGGERRFNVLITRAKWRMEVFSSIRSAEINKAGKKPGVHHFRDFLAFAETGQLELSRTTRSNPEFPFSRHVADVLIREGYEVERQVGVAGYFVDIAIRHPQDRNQFVIGIECDSPTYYSSKSARDRDRLRESVLRDRGWNFHRIWSIDWFVNREAAVQNLLTSVSRIANDSSTGFLVLKERAPSK